MDNAMNVCKKGIKEDLIDHVSFWKGHILIESVTYHSLRKSLFIRQVNIITHERSRKEVAVRSINLRSTLLNKIASAGKNLEIQAQVKKQWKHH